MNYDLYLSRTLARVLPECLESIMVLQPADPIAAISEWLHKASSTQMYYKERLQYSRRLKIKKEEEERDKMESVDFKQMLEKYRRQSEEFIKAGRQEEKECLLWLIASMGDQGNGEPQPVEKVQRYKQQLMDMGLSLYDINRKLSKLTLEEDPEVPLTAEEIEVLKKRFHSIRKEERAEGRAKYLKKQAQFTPDKIKQMKQRQLQAHRDFIRFGSADYGKSSLRSGRGLSGAEKIAKEMEEASAGDGHANEEHLASPPPGDHTPTPSLPESLPESELSSMSFSFFSDGGDDKQEETMFKGDIQVRDYYT